MASNTRLSVNINKIATLRNARGENVPDVIKVALDCEIFGAQGITVHPRPDQRHITRRDVFALSEAIKTELNVEGYPSEDFMKLIKEVRPAQVTLVPDAPDAITSNSGWDVEGNIQFLTHIIGEINSLGIRTSIFVAPELRQIEAAASTGTSRVELYTKPYASKFLSDPQNAVEKYVTAAELAHSLGLGINAGHDLNLANLKFFDVSLPWLDEVSIGHALISDALYLGLRETIRQYLECLDND